MISKYVVTLVHMSVCSHDDLNFATDYDYIVTQHDYIVTVVEKMVNMWC